MTNKRLKALPGRPAWWTTEFEWGLSTCGDYVRWPMSMSWTEMDLDPTNRTAQYLLSAFWSLGKTVPDQRRDLYSQVENLTQLEHQLQQAQAITRRRRALMTDQCQTDEEAAYDRECVEDAPPYVVSAQLSLCSADGTVRLLKLHISPEGRIEPADESEVQPDYETILTVREALSLIEESVKRQDSDPTDWTHDGGLPQ